jgi:hypothetical protein
MLIDDPAKIAPGLDTRHIHEHRVLAKISGEIIEQSAGLTFGVFPAIAYEDGTHSALPCRLVFATTRRSVKTSCRFAESAGDNLRFTRRLLFSSWSSDNSMEQ